MAEYIEFLPTTEIQQTIEVKTERKLVPTRIIIEYELKNISKEIEKEPKQNMPG
jgi:hypothetical protein